MDCDDIFIMVEAMIKVEIGGSGKYISLGKNKYQSLIILEQWIIKN